MNAKDIKVGDRLRIRRWDDMVAEFGYNEFCIGVPYGFNEEMQYMCGESFTVKSITIPYRSFEGIENSKNHFRGYWSISAEMLEPIEEDDIEDISDDELSDIL